MQKLMMILVLCLLAGPAVSDAIGGPDEDRAAGQKPAADSERGTEPAKAEEKKAEPDCKACAEREAKRALKKAERKARRKAERKAAKEAAKKDPKDAPKQEGGKSAGAARGCDECGDGHAPEAKVGGRSEAGKGQGKGNGNGWRGGRGAGRGNGHGAGQGRGQGAGRGNGPGAGRGQGAGAGGGQGGSCALVDDGTEAKPASKEYLARLQATLEEELYARDYYRKAHEALDNFRRFGNLSRAEQNHANAVAAAITRLGGKPVLEHKTKIVVPASVAAADAECTVIEKKVIEIYAGLIKDCPDEAVRKSLERIQEANRRHLSAVSR